MDLGRPSYRPYSGFYQSLYAEADGIWIPFYGTFDGPFFEQQRPEGSFPNPYMLPLDPTSGNPIVDGKPLPVLRPPGTETNWAFTFHDHVLRAQETMDAGTTGISILGGPWRYELKYQGSPFHLTSLSITDHGNGGNLTLTPHPSASPGHLAEEPYTLVMSKVTLTTLAQGSRVMNSFALEERASHSAPPPHTVHVYLLTQVDCGPDNMLPSQGLQTLQVSQGTQLLTSYNCPPQQKIHTWQLELLIMNKTRGLEVATSNLGTGRMDLRYAIAAVQSEDYLESPDCLCLKPTPP